MRFRVRRALLWGMVALAISLVIRLQSSPSGLLGWDLAVTPAVTILPASAATSLPEAKPHPLPPSLSRWHDAQQKGDYFEQIKPIRVGYLIWSRFPVMVYLEPISPEDLANSARRRQAEDWISAVRLAVREWTAYLPMELVSQPETADITILRSPPPLRIEPDTASEPETATDSTRRPTLRLSRARSAETRFDLYLKPSTRTGSSTLLAHRFTIRLRPDQPALYLQAAARHELGHALGIWGHSQLETDALYFAQVRHPPRISARDISTLKRIYEQPTRLGWPLSQASDQSSPD